MCQYSHSCQAAGQIPFPSVPTWASRAAPRNRASQPGAAMPQPWSGEAVGHRDQRCLRLLLAHGASLAGTWAVGAAVHHDDPGALALLLPMLPRPSSRPSSPDTLTFPAR